MSNYLSKHIVAFLAVMTAIWILAPSTEAFQQTHSAPQVGTIPVFDGGKRAQWRGYLDNHDNWWKKDSHNRRSPIVGQFFPHWFFETESE